jgi:hypothetical protein
MLPIRADTRAKLVTGIARARRWLSEIEASIALSTRRAILNCRLRYLILCQKVV